MSALPFTAEEYKARIDKTFELMKQQGWDALLCYASAIIPGNVRFLTGYETRLRIHDAVYFLVTPETDPEFTLFSNASWERPEELSWVQNVVMTSNFGAEIASRISPGTKRLGVVGHRYLPLPAYLGIHGRHPALEIVDATDAFTKLRMVKSKAEIEILRRCAQITDCAGHTFLRSIREGAIEREVAAEVERAMKLQGSDEVSFSTQVGCGERTARVVVHPGDAAFQSGDPVQLDCGATYLGYRGDLSRVAVVGSPSPDYRKMLEATTEMYFQCVEALRPGVTSSSVAEIGIGIAKSYQLEQYLYRSPNHEPGFVGHAVGCHYCEPPELHPDDHTVLEEGMVLVVEPILMRPGVGGVKIEDAVLVTSNGVERFSSCPIRTWDNG